MAVHSTAAVIADDTALQQEVQQWIEDREEDRAGYTMDISAGASSYNRSSYDRVRGVERIIEPT